MNIKVENSIVSEATKNIIKKQFGSEVTVVESPLKDENNQMPTFFRIDEWHKSGSGSKVHFEKTAAEALSWTLGMNEATPEQTNGREHTTIQAFVAETCDMDGWDKCRDSGTIVHYTS